MGPKRRNVPLKKRDCLFCGKISPTYAALELHMNVHTLERPFICTTCGSCYASSSSLWVHQTAVHLGRKYICDICQKECNAQANLIQHRKMHGKIALKNQNPLKTQKPVYFRGNAGNPIKPNPAYSQNGRQPVPLSSKSKVLRFPARRGVHSRPLLKKPISQNRKSPPPEVVKRVVVRWDESFFLHLNRYVPET